MLNPKIFDDIAKKLKAVLPSKVLEAEKEIEKNFRAILQSAFTELNLVTREEFDIQANVLAKTRANLDVMEKRLEEIERILSESRS